MDQSSFRAVPYIPGNDTNKPELLSRYLPPVPDGVISTWLIKNVPRGSWILDPFGASPRLVVEAARAGYRLFVTANNPIARFLLEMIAAPPKSEDLQAALAELAASYKAEERIEPHIRALYNTRCARCGQIISAEAFLWEQGSPSPYARIYSCPHCGDSGEHPCTQFDVDQAGQFTASGLHKARALERVVSATDQDRIHVEQALLVYIPRALYALITLINKVEGLQLPLLSQKYLSLLLLHAFDQSNALWRIPTSRERRRQLTIPRRFRENNIWLALEQGIDLWSFDNFSELVTEVPISIWPEEPPETGGICIYEGRLISIADSLRGFNIQAVCAAIPRPNQAYWTLSALWAGWLWGREAVGTFKSVLHRQRYDWSWHTNALASVFKQLPTCLDASTPIFGLIGEAEPGFIASTLAAAGFSGCYLKGIAIRQEEDQAQILWRVKSETEPPKMDSSLTQLCISSAQSYLDSRGEPASYLNTITAAFINIVPYLASERDSAKREIIATSDTQKAADTGDGTEAAPSLQYSNMYNTARESLTYRSGFLQYNLQDLSNLESSIKNQTLQESLFSLETGKIKPDEEQQLAPQPTPDGSETTVERERITRSSDVSESVYIWLRNADHVKHISITDRYESTFVNYLATHPGCRFADLDWIMCERFQGIYTPDPEFIRACLESYGLTYESDTDKWQLRPEDRPDERQIDIVKTQLYIHQIGERLGVRRIENRSDNLNSIIWKDAKGDLEYQFYTTSMANIGEIVLYHGQTITKNFVVLPGSRVNLIFYKINRDPRLNKAFNPTTGNWQILKFRHIRSLADNPLLNRENLDQLLSLDPLTYSTPQLRLM